jgi:hypothetical protein
VAPLNYSELVMVVSPTEFDAFLRKDIEKWAQLAKISGAIGQ